ncbi:MAG: SH3 domain-containing protein [Clostridia bacterium]|nr:SH3 domain-containing protein [Clostridia bacterium]
MKRLVLLVLSLALCLSACAAMADGNPEWLYSRLNGWVQLASYVGEYDGYVCVDGLGGVTLADDYRVTVISKNASVWAEPRTNSKKLASAPHGKSMLCRSDDGGESLLYEKGFYAVEYSGKDGWINEDYVVLNDLTITLLESNVPAYIAPDTTSKKVGSLSKLTSYRVIGFYDDFYIINLRDAAAAFIPMSVMHRDNTFDRNYHGGGGMHRSAATLGKATLRTGPGSRYPEIRTLKAGTKVTVMDEINDWYLILDSETNTWAFLAPDSLAL